jgi:acetyltransferase-like isoleucine patch superfamily enzyme
MQYTYKVDDHNELRFGACDLDQNSLFEVKGEKNHIEVCDGVRGRLVAKIAGSEPTNLIIKHNVRILGTLEIVVRRGGANIFIGSDCTFQGACRMYVYEPSSILIGRDAMFSGDILLTTSDMHPIFDNAGARINSALPISLGDHVWVGSGARILKGASIGSGCVVGMSAVVTRGDYPESCIIAGNPAKIVRTDVRWERNF